MVKFTCPLAQLPCRVPYPPQEPPAGPQPLYASAVPRGAHQPRRVVVWPLLPQCPRRRGAEGRTWRRPDRCRHTVSVSQGRPTLCPSAPPPAPQPRRGVAPGGRLAQPQGRAALSVAGRRSRRQPPGSSRTTSAGHARRQDVLPHAAHGLARRAPGAHHGATGARWGGHARAPAGCGAPPASLPDEPGGPLAPAHAAARAPPARGPGARARPALPRRVWPPGGSRPPATSPLRCPRLPPADDATIPDLASEHRPEPGRVTDEGAVALPPLAPVRISGRGILTTPLLV
jgi:hypothetical protein